MEDSRVRHIKNNSQMPWSTVATPPQGHWSRPLYTYMHISASGGVCIPKASEKQVPDNHCIALVIQTFQLHVHPLAQATCILASFSISLLHTHTHTHIPLTHFPLLLMEGNGWGGHLGCTTKYTNQEITSMSSSQFTLAFRYCHYQVPGKYKCTLYMQLNSWQGVLYACSLQLL